MQTMRQFLKTPEMQRFCWFFRLLILFWEAVDAVFQGLGKEKAAREGSLFE